MASKNSVKIYSENSFYHVYNRGVEKRNIFVDEQDFSVFLSYLQTYLIPKNEKSLRNILASQESSSQEKDKAIKLLRLNNYSDEIELHCYALLPNHFHIVLKQQHNVLHSFMNSLGTRYSMYFNRKYKRIGVLFQDVYKAVLIENDEQLLQLSRYIHLNPTEWFGLPPTKWAVAQFPCSIHEYLNLRKTGWIERDYILNYFSKTNKELSYERFLGLGLVVNNNQMIGDIAIDLETD